MKLAIVGYGKMGRLVEQFAPEYDFKAALKLDEFNNVNFRAIVPENFAGIRVAIEFSTPETAVEISSASPRSASTWWSGRRAGWRSWIG
jgi:4-hydroxy-tetrahydrodipicolinate reductase